MARIRSLKPEFWTDEKLAGLPREIRHTFIGVISACADDVGRFKANPRLVKAAVYPLDDELTAPIVGAELEQLAAIGVLQLYTVNGEQYGHVVNWSKHQKIDKATKSRLPEPPGEVPVTFDECSSNPRRTLATEAEAERGVDLGSGSGAERMGGSDRGANVGAGEAVPDKAGTLARWLARYYANAAPARREQVREQLTALYRGQEVRLRKALVRARSVEHLERKAEEMLEIGFTVRDDDKAIVVLLTKLADYEKDALGRLPSEAAAADARAAEQLADAHESARKKAVAEWRDAHAVELAELEQECRSVMTTPKTDIGYRAELAMRVNAVIVERVGFPDFDTWRAQRRAS